MYINRQPSQGGGRGTLPASVKHLRWILHGSVVLVSISLAIGVFDKSLFSWHPVFMSLGYLLFMTEGLISAIMFRHLDGPERVKAIQGHALLQLRAVLCIIAGFAVIYRNKILLGKAHFQSTHAKCGLASLILSILAPLQGVISFRKLGIIQKFPERLQPSIKALHRSMGLITWLLAMLTIQLALPHKAVYKATLTPLWQAGVALMTLSMLALHVKARFKLKEDLPQYDMSVKSDLNTAWSTTTLR